MRRDESMLLHIMARTNGLQVTEWIGSLYQAQNHRNTYPKQNLQTTASPFFCEPNPEYCINLLLGKQTLTGTTKKCLLMILKRLFTDSFQRIWKLSYLTTKCIYNKCNKTTNIVLWIKNYRTVNWELNWYVFLKYRPHIHFVSHWIYEWSADRRSKMPFEVYWFSYHPYEHCLI